MKKKKNTASKPRASKYEEKVSFAGSFTDFIKLTVASADKKLAVKKA